VAIAIGPQYGTVSSAFIKGAAREAIRAEDVDLLCVLGFAFDPQTTGVTQQDGVTVEPSEEASPTWRDSARSARSRCCSSG